LQIKRNCLLMFPCQEVQVGELAPAVRQIWRQPQGRLVVAASQFEIATEGCGFAKLLVQCGDGFAGFSRRSGDGKTRLEGGNRLFKSASLEAFQAEAQLPFGERDGRFGFNAGGGACCHGLSPLWEDCAEEPADLDQCVVNKALSGWRAASNARAG